MRLIIKMANSAGIFQVDELLRPKLKNSTIEDHVEIIAKIERETVMEVYEF